MTMENKMTNSNPARLEHLNVTVTDAKATADMLCDLFGWHIRWEGDSIYDGYSVHVGGTDSYIALYNGREKPKPSPQTTYQTKAGLNHLAVVVDDLDAVEERVKARGYVPNSHADYEPGRRFYFDDEDGLEIEVVQYD